MGGGVGPQLGRVVLLVLSITAGSCAASRQARRELVAGRSEEAGALSSGGDDQRGQKAQEEEEEKVRWTLHESGRFGKAFASHYAGRCVQAAGQPHTLASHSARPHSSLLWSPALGMQRPKKGVCTFHRRRHTTRFLLASANHSPHYATLITPRRWPIRLPVPPRTSSHVHSPIQARLHRGSWMLRAGGGAADFSGTRSSEFKSTRRRFPSVLIIPCRCSISLLVRIRCSHNQPTPG